MTDETGQLAVGDTIAPRNLVADPDRLLYQEFGVGRSVRANLHPSAWIAPLRAQTWTVVARGLRAGARPGLQGDTMLGLPADFLIGCDGTIRAARYGRHANDQWALDDLLELAGDVDPCHSHVPRATVRSQTNIAHPEGQRDTAR